MPITYTVGVPRSGKSYRVTYKIYKEFICKKKNILQRLFPKIFKFKETEYLYCYTNINQFNFELDSRFKKLDWNQFYVNMNVLRMHHLAGMPDNELIEIAKDLKLYKCLIAVDEVANLLRKKDDPVLLFWFSYHGHLFQDIELIVQHMSMVGTEYKKNAEYFYKAIPKQFRIFQGGFKYSQYQTSLMAKTEFIKSFTLPKDVNVFNMYVSGSDPKASNVLLKFLIPIPFLFGYFVYAFSNFSLDDENKKDKENISKEQVVVDVKNNTLPNDKILETSSKSNDVLSSINTLENEQLKLFKFNCFDTLCYYKFEDNTLYEIPQNILKSYLLDIDTDKKYLELKNNKLSIYVLVKKSKFNFIIEKGLDNEKNKNNDSSSVIGFK